MSYQPRVNDIVAVNDPTIRVKAGFVQQIGGGVSACWNAEIGSFRANNNTLTLITNLDNITPDVGKNKEILQQLGIAEFLPADEIPDLEFLNNGIDQERIGKVYSYEFLVTCLIKCLVLFNRLEDISKATMAMPSKSIAQPSYESMVEKLAALQRTPYGAKTTTATSKGKTRSNNRLITSDDLIQKINNDTERQYLDVSGDMVYNDGSAFHASVSTPGFRQIMSEEREPLPDILEDIS